mmetsp:Transcript_2175/g.3320  ORF Transcript_2175/g.3320 Transcript_2175/m.3320 type:complete len:80 (-) Transcript_2175:654-893(-)
MRKKPKMQDHERTRRFIISLATVDIPPSAPTYFCVPQIGDNHRCQRERCVFPSRVCLILLSAASPSNTADVQIVQTLLT